MSIKNSYNIRCGNHQTVKDGCLVIIPHKRNGGGVFSFCGKYSYGGDTITFFECLTLALGAATLLTNLVSCIVSVMQWLDATKKK